MRIVLLWLPEARRGLWPLSIPIQPIMFLMLLRALLSAFAEQAA
jgi:hypothetical protein